MFSAIEEYKVKKYVRNFVCTNLHSQLSLEQLQRVGKLSQIPKLVREALNRLAPNKDRWDKKKVRKIIHALLNLQSKVDYQSLYNFSQPFNPISLPK